jgi:hypothetical protein
MTSYATDEKEHDEYVALLEQENAKLLAALEDMLFCFAPAQLSPKPKVKKPKRNSFCAHGLI